MNDNKKYKKYSNKFKYSKSKKIPYHYYNNNKKQDETKKLLKNSHHQKKSKYHNNIFFEFIDSIQNRKEIYLEFSFVFKFYLVLFLLFTFLFLSLLCKINNTNGGEQSSKDKNFDIKKDFKLKGLIKVGYFCESIKYGGVERVISLLLNYLSKEKYFSHYLITKKEILQDEYPIPNNIKRISLKAQNITLFDAIENEHIDILVYNFYENPEIEKLNKLNKTKVIYYNHSSFLLWIYQKLIIFEYTVYQVYKECKYVISLIPVENDYLFKKWGINSILMDNPTTFEYESVIPSDLSNKNIIMIGRAEDPIKRYDLGIKAMRNILKEMPESEMNIISSPNDKLERLINIFKLENKVKFVGFHKNVEIYLKNSSLHILPSLSETYPMILGETKIFGIPTIICGLDYLALAKGGTVMIYDDNPDTIAKEAINILKNETYRKQLGKEARESMKIHKNKLIAEKWVKLLLSVYIGDDESYKNLNSHNIMTEEEANIILENQLNLLKKRKPRFRRVSLENFKFFNLKKK